nr:MAG: hypothetical protein [Chuviridae sp.]
MPPSCICIRVCCPPHVPLYPCGLFGVMYPPGLLVCQCTHHIYPYNPPYLYSYPCTLYASPCILSIINYAKLARDPITYYIPDFSYLFIVLLVLEFGPSYQ